MYQALTLAATCGKH